MTETVQGGANPASSASTALVPAQTPPSPPSTSTALVRVKPNQSIEQALVENGLIQKDEIDRSDKSGTKISGSLGTGRATPSGTQVIEGKPRRSITAGSRPHQGQQTQASRNGAENSNHKRSQSTVHLPTRHIVRPDTPVDPDHVPDKHGFTPFMYRLTADPGFPLLSEILSTKRPRGTVSETRLIAKLLWTLDGATEDHQGNIIVDRGENPHGVLWSCHTDTVHAQNEQGTQKLELSRKGDLRLAFGERASCLGADDGTGMWIMLQMFHAGVPGRYVFHYGEESGCIGSKYIASERKHVLEGIRYAIAFDRAGTEDVVISQRGTRCASDTFAHSIARQLPGTYAPARGVYTDTAEYLRLVPECTNLSVGYQGQHGPGEIQNLPHLYALRDAMLKIDPSQFVCERDPKAQEVSPFRSGQGYSQAWAEYFRDRYGSDIDGVNEDWGRWLDREEGQRSGWSKNESSQAASDESQDSSSGAHAGEEEPFDGIDHDPDERLAGRKPQNMTEQEYEDFLDESYSLGRPKTPEDMSELIARYPEEAALALRDIGFDVCDLWEDILTSLNYKLRNRK